MDALLHPDEVAELFCVTRKSITSWVGRGLLPAIRLPDGSIRFERKAIEDWLRSGGFAGIVEPGQTRGKT